MSGIIFPPQFFLRPKMNIQRDTPRSDLSGFALSENIYIGDLPFRTRCSLLYLGFAA